MLGDGEGTGVGGAVVDGLVACGVTVCCGVAVRCGDGVTAGVGEWCGVARGVGRGVRVWAGAGEFVCGTAADEAPDELGAGGLTQR